MDSVKIKKYILLLLAWFPLNCFSAPPDTGFFIDLAHPSARFEYTTFAGNTPSIPVTILTNGFPYNGFAGYSCELNYTINDSASSLKTITGTVSGNIATFQALTNSFPVHGDYFCEVYFSTTYGASKITAGQGMLHVNRSPSSNAHGSLNLVPRINFDTLTFVGTPPWTLLTEPVFLASVSYNISSAMTNNWTSSYLDELLLRAQFNAASNQFYITIGQQTTNLNTASNALNTALTNFEAQVQGASNNIIGMFGSTNDILAQLNTVITNQAASNLTFQTFNAVQLVTNANFDTRITTVTTGNVSLITYNAGITAQANTNGFFQSLLSALGITNATFQTLFNYQAATNSGFWTLFVNQWNTNSGFETRMETVETGKVSLVLQTSTNSGFQTLFGNQVNTNAGFQSLFTNQFGTNVTHWTLITNQFGTNVLFWNHIVGVETGKMNQAAQTATNAQLFSLVSSIITSNSISRYYADTTPGEQVEVLATGGGITAARIGSTFSFTIPAGVKLYSVRLRINGGNTDSGIIRLSMGTTDMNQGSVTNDWMPSANAFNETTPFNNVTLTCQPDVADQSLIKVFGLGTSPSVTYNCHFVF